MALSLYTTVAYAHSFDINKTGIMTIEYKYNEVNIQGAKISLYHVASVDVFSFPKFVYKLNATFADSGVTVNDLNTAENIKNAALQLLGYAESQGVSAITGTTNSMGQLQFNNLIPGLYLASQTGATPQTNSEGYENFVPFLVDLPQAGEGSVDWEYSITAEPKTSPITYPEHTTSLTVTKLWSCFEEDGYPDSVEVTLFRDGKAYGVPVVLSAFNEWKHTWTGLDVSHKWTVDELNVPEGYKKTILAQGTTNVVIVNALLPPPDATDHITVTKRWAGRENPKQPTQVKVQLYKNGEPEGEAVSLDASNNWTFSWNELQEGNTWTVDEIEVPKGYTKTIIAQGTVNVVIVNSYTDTPPDGSDNPSAVTVTKLWAGTPQQDQPENITVQLYRNGKAYGDSVVLNSDSFWEHTWTDLDPDYKWTVDEVNVPDGYVKKIVGNGTENVIISNTPKSDIPKTGDNTRLDLYTGVMCISGAAVLSLYYFGRRKRRDN